LGEKGKYPKMLKRVAQVNVKNWKLHKYTEQWNMSSQVQSSAVELLVKIHPKGTEIWAFKKYAFYPKY